MLHTTKCQAAPKVVVKLHPNKRHAALFVHTRHYPMKTMAGRFLGQRSAMHHHQRGSGREASNDSQLMLFYGGM
jgi:hypothetical protein